MSTSASAPQLDYNQLIRELHNLESSAYENGSVTLNHNQRWALTAALAILDSSRIRSLLQDDIQILQEASSHAGESQH